MAQPKKKPRARAAPSSKDPEALAKYLYVIKNRHAAALRTESLNRALVTGTARPDASAVLRDVLDSWLTKGKR